MRAASGRSRSVSHVSAYTNVSCTVSLNAVAYSPGAELEWEFRGLRNPGITLRGWLKAPVPDEWHF
jgi:hypothetical protein